MFPQRNVREQAGPQFSSNLGGRERKLIDEIFKEKKSLMKDLSVEKLIENYLGDTRLMELITTYVKSKTGKAECRKSDTEALELKEYGNREYQLKNLNEALIFYNDSIVVGTPSSLAIAYSNKSVVLFEMNEFKQGLTDIERALSYECNDLLKLKLYVRKVKCHLKLKYVDEAEKSLKLIEVWLEKAEIPEGKKTATKDVVVKLRAEIHGVGDTSDEANYTSELKLSYGSNSKIPPLSAAVDILYSEDKGRYAVANRPLQMGDVMLMEKPFVCTLKNVSIHLCSNCASSTLMSTVPCPPCSQVRYCSEECRDESWRKHHSFECGYQLFVNHGDGPLIALRMLLASGIENVLGMKDELERRSENDQLPGFNEKGEFEHETYYAIYHMSRFNEDIDFDVKQNFVINSAIYILKLLEFLYPQKIDNMEMEDQLKQSRKDKMDAQGATGSCFTFEERMFLSTTLARNLLSVKCNSTKVIIPDLMGCAPMLPFFRSTETTDMGDQVGSSINPVASSFFNHSCDPNLHPATTVDSLSIFKVSMDVAKGEELCVTYGPIRYVNSLIERLSYLQNYSFSCKCSSCEDEKEVQDFSLIELNENFETSVSRLLSSDASRDSIKKILMLSLNFRQAKLNVESLNFPAAIMLFDRCLELAEAEQEHSDSKMFTSFVEIHKEMSHCLEQLRNQLEDDSTGDVSFPNLDGTRVTRTRPPNLTLLSDIVERGLKSLPKLTDFQIDAKNNFVVHHALTYTLSLATMLKPLRDRLGDYSRWRSLSITVQDWLKNISSYGRKRAEILNESDFLQHLLVVENAVNECLKN